MNEVKMAQENGSHARLKRIMEEMERGLRFVETFDEMRVVTFYGSARASTEDSWYAQAYDLAKKLASDDNSIAVCTGGGPGVMEAGNKGAKDAGGVSIGIGIELPTLGEVPNSYATHRMDFYYFFARKMALVHIAQGHVFFPGGVGTMDEFFELLTLISTEKMQHRQPIVLVDSKYWEGLFAWMRETMSEKYHAFSESFLDKRLHITDDMDEAYRLLDAIPSRLHISDEV
jgi:uncharacterized protein (TIGR00730 family)